MDMHPSHGIGRALFTALDLFAHESGHAELSSSKLILLGFSGTGALFAHFVGYSPDRVVAAILADPGHYDPVGMDNVRLSTAAISVPELSWRAVPIRYRARSDPTTTSVNIATVALLGRSFSKTKHHIAASSTRNLWYLDG
jgi:pimeloyl-ACP methyl ester carboxylesterase